MTITRSHESEFPSSNVERKIEHLMRRYEDGKEFQAYNLCPEGREQIGALARSKGISPPDVHWYIRFAAEFSEEDLEALYERCRDMNFGLSFTHFRIFLSVRNRETRAELIDQTIRERLGTVRARQLKDRLVINPASQGGRRSQLLTLDEDEVEWIINRNADKLCRQLRQVTSARRDMQPDRLERLQELLDHLQELLDRLE